MQVDPEKAVGSSEYNGATYYFCALRCKQKFDQSPAQYAKYRHAARFAYQGASLHARTNRRN